MNDEYYYVVYRQGNRTEDIEVLYQQHPLIWAQQYTDVVILFWKEIPEEIYDRVKGKL